MIPPLAVTGLLVAVSLGAIVVTAIRLRPAALRRQASRWGERLGLPVYGARAAAVVARLRALDRAIGGAVAVAAAVAAAVSLTAPGDGLHFVLVALPVLAAAAAAASAWVSVRERLFDPPTTADRVARARRVDAADYLGRWRVVLPIAVSVVAAMAVAASAWSGAPPVVPLVLLGLGVAALAATPFVDRLVLDAPQPASDSVELAWDDAFRTATLAALRAVPCFAAIAAVVAILPQASAPAFVLQIGVYAVSWIYDRAPLRRALRPTWSTTGAVGR